MAPISIQTWNKAVEPPERNECGLISAIGMRFGAAAYFNVASAKFRILDGRIISSLSGFQSSLTNHLLAPRTGQWHAKLLLTCATLLFCHFHSSTCRKIWLNSVPIFVEKSDIASPKIPNLRNPHATAKPDRNGIQNACFGCQFGEVHRPTSYCITTSPNLQNRGPLSTRRFPFNGFAK